MKIIALMPIAAALAMIGAGYSKSDNPLTTVEKVDLNRYVGKWYEIARNPAWFQKGCFASTAEYVPRKDGDINVINTCREGSVDGKLDTAKGKAWVVDKTTNAKLKVRFFWPFSGDYWVIDLGKDYEYAVVGEPGRKYLWILSRTPNMDEKVFGEILKRVESKGYDISKLIIQ